MVNLADWKSHAEARTLAFMTEHDLKLNKAPHLIDYAKEMARDPKALDNITMSRTSATYKLVDGLGAATQKRLVNDMKENFFSLNVDESTSSANQKIFTAMVSYFSKERQETVVKHYKSVTLIVANAKSVLEAVKSMLEEDQIPFDNLISVLSDSANYMRGKKGDLNHYYVLKNFPMPTF